MSLSKTYGTKLPAKLEKKFLKYCDREGLSPSRALAKAIDAVVVPSPNRQWYVAELVKNVAAVMAENGLSSADELRKSLGKEVGNDLEERVEKAVAKAIASLDGGLGRFKGSAISQYVPDPADQRPNGGYLSGEGQDPTGDSNFDPDPANDEARDSGWQSDDEDGSVPTHGAPMSKLVEAGLRNLGVDTRKKKPLRKSADTNPTEGFTLGSNEFVPEKSAGYKTSADYPGGGIATGPFEVSRQLHNNGVLAKRADVMAARTPKDINRLGKVISAGCGGDPEEYTDAINAVFGTLKKA